MGLQFDRILNCFDGPFQPIPYGELQSPKTNFIPTSSPAGYILDSRSNNSFIAVNDLLRSGTLVYRIANTLNIKPVTGKGSFFIPANTGAKLILQKAAKDLGVNIMPVKKRPAEIEKISSLRIALWDTYGGSIPSGWMRWIMEQHHFTFNVIYSKEIDAGDLKNKYDVIVFVGGAIPPLSVTTRTAGRDTSLKPESIPAEFRGHIGRISADTSIPQLKKFLEAGGNIVTIGSSTQLAYHLKLPVRNALVEMINGKSGHYRVRNFIYQGV